MAIFPSREVVLHKIRALRDSSDAREEVAAWAISIVDDDTVEVADKDAWAILKSMGAADLPGGDRKYLYADEDFAEWERKLI